MAEIFLCNVSAVHAAEGTVDVAVADREGMIRTDVPMLDTVYEMPEIGDLVAVVFEERGGALLRGVVLGRPYSKANRPGQSGDMIFCKEFADGAYVKYDSSSKVMEVNAAKIHVNQLVAEHIVYRTVCEKG